jgi:CRP-like cAMP-binding protein
VEERGEEIGKGSVQGANASSVHRAQSIRAQAASSNDSPAPQLSASSTSSYFATPPPLSFIPPTRPPMDTPPLSRREDGAQRSVPVSGVNVTALGRLDAGDFIGHREIMRGEPHAYTVIGSEPCKYYTLNKQDILSLVVQSPDIALEQQAALGHAVFDEEQHTAEKRSRRRKLHFISEVEEKFLASRMQFKRKDSALNRVVMRIMRSSRKQSASVAPMASRSGSRRDSTGSEIHSKLGKIKRMYRWTGPIDQGMERWERLRGVQWEGR